MKFIVKQLLKQALILNQLSGELKIDRTQQAIHGDYSINIAFILAQRCDKSASRLAQLVVSAIPAHPLITRVNADPSGFINFFISDDARVEIIRLILEEDKPALTCEVTIDPAGFDLDTIHYAYDRTNSILAQCQANGLSADRALGLANLARLCLTQEQDLLNRLDDYLEITTDAARHSTPDDIGNFLQQLAYALHTYLNRVPIACNEDDLRSARLCLLDAIRHVLCNGLVLLGFTSAESIKNG